jgi:transposase
MDSDQLPPDLTAAHAMILAERAARLAAEAKLAEVAHTQAKQSSTEALIAHLKLEIEKLRRTLYGARSERSARLLDQLELELEELEATATEYELAAEKAGKTETVRSFKRKRPVRVPRPLAGRVPLSRPCSCRWTRLCPRPDR